MTRPKIRAVISDLLKLRPEGYPKTRKGWIKRARSQRWSHSIEYGLGGDRLVYELPEELARIVAHRRGLAAVAAGESARAASTADELGREAAEWAAGERAKDEEAERRLAASRAAGERKWKALPDGKLKRRGKAREWMLRRYWEYRRAHEGFRIHAAEEFCRELLAARIEVPPEVSRFIPHYRGAHSITQLTLRRWEDLYHEHGVYGLASGYGTRDGQSIIAGNEPLARVILAAILEAPHITSKKIRSFLTARHHELPQLAPRTIQRYIQRWQTENAQLWTLISRPDRWKHVYLSSHGSQSEHVVRLNQLWQIDATPGDWLLTDGRCMVVVVIDIFSRRVKFRVSKSSKATVVCTLLRAAILDWGVPEGVKTDNGQEFIGEQLSRALIALAITHFICIPFASEEKGHVERVIGTMSHGLLDLLTGFIGHNVAERAAIRERQSFAERIMKGEDVEVGTTSAELQRALDDWAEHVYAKDPHAGLGGRSPFEVRASWCEPIRRVGAPETVDCLLAEVAGTRTIGKKGIRFEGRDYIHPALPEHTGKEARLYYDDADMGRLQVWLVGAEQFLCWALEPSIAGISRQEFAVAAKAGQKQWAARVKKELREFTRGQAQDVAGTVIRHRIEESKKLAMLPQPSIEHDTPALREAARASEEGRRQAPAHRPPSDEELRPYMEQAQAEAAVNLVALSDPQRHAYWKALDERRARGEHLDARDSEFWRTWQDQSYYVEQTRLDAEFERFLAARAAEQPR